MCSKILISYVLLFLLTSSCFVIYADDDGEESADDEIQNILGDEDGNSTVVFAQVWFRNGLHAVETDDPYNTSYHEEDVTDLRLMADLTKRGKNQEYMIGKYLRERYENLFNHSYSQYKMRMFSGYKNRSMTSAALVLAGMFPPEQDYEIWNQDLRWQPIPIHINTKITDTDSMNLALLGACANLDWVTETEAYNLLIAHYNHTIEFLCDMVREDYSVLTAMSLSSALIGLNEYPGSEPEWANTTVMETARDYYWDIHSFVTSFHEVVRLTAGWMLEDAINEMKSFMSRQTERKFVGYSMHVDNQNALLVSLNNKSAPKNWPPMGGFMSIELHYIDEEYVVKAFYWYKSYTEPIQVNISNCEDPCTLEKFEARSKDYHVDNWALECGQTAESATKPNISSSVEDSSSDSQINPDEISDSSSTSSSSDETTASSSDENTSSASDENTSSSSDDTTSDETTSTATSTGSGASTGVLLTLCIIFGLLFLVTLVLLIRTKKKLRHREDYFEIK